MFKRLMHRWMVLEGESGDAPAGGAPAAAPAPAADPAPAAPEAPDEFSAAFDELDKAAGAAPTPTPAPAAPATPADPAAPTPTPAPAPAPAAPATPADPAAPTPTPTPAPAVPEGFVSRADFEALQQRIEQLSAPAPAPAAPAAPAPAPAPIYTAEEQAAIEKYAQDWPDIAKGEALQRRGEYHALVSHVLKQFEAYVAPLVEVVQRMPAIEETTQLRELRDAIEDYDAIRDPALAWIETQPDYLKNAFTQITQTGTVDQIADMIDRFRKETGWVAPAGSTNPPATPTAAPAAPSASTVAATPTMPAAPALPAGTAAVVASLKPVKSGRTEPTSAKDPNDFDSAWSEFAQAEAR